MTLEEVLARPRHRAGWPAWRAVFKRRGAITETYFYAEDMEDARRYADGMAGTGKGAAVLQDLTEFEPGQR